MRFDGVLAPPRWMGLLGGLSIVRITHWCPQTTSTEREGVPQLQGGRMRC